VALLVTVVMVVAVSISLTMSAAGAAATLLALAVRVSRVRLSVARGWTGPSTILRSPSYWPTPPPYGDKPIGP
jgi:hypothetical protein